MADEQEKIPSQGRDDFLADLLLLQGFGEGVRYDHMRQRWLLWNGKRWSPDKARKIYDLMREKAVEAWNVAAESNDGATIKMLSTIFDTSKKEGVLKSLSAREGIAMAGDEWDADPYLLGFNNGVLDLRTMKFNSAPSPDTLISKTTRWDWDPDATAPVFGKFVRDIMDNDDDMVVYLMTLLGYSLFGLQSEQKFWMWVGRGSNGKGILARTMVKVLGDYADSPSATLYMRNRFGAAPSSAARPDLVRLQGLRFTYMSEPPGREFDEELLKAHTGEDVVLARDLYGKADSMSKFSPTHKIIFLTNDPPKTEDVGISMRRRARVIRFEQDYTDERADFTLEPRIQSEEAQGILTLLAKCAKAWWKDGKPKLTEPAKVKEWSESYISDNDPLSKFITECCVLGAKAQGNATLLWSAYEDWAARNGVESKSQIAFGVALGKRFRKERVRTGSIYHGICTKNAMEAAVAGA